MNYQIIPQDDTVQVKITDDNGISEIVDMLEEIPVNSILVSANRKDVLGEVNLKKMLAYLEYCVDLLQIAIIAVDCLPVQAKVQNLSAKFSDAMIRSNTMALDFKLTTKTVVESYIEAYVNLLYGEVEIAVEILKDIKPFTQKMEIKTDELVNIYDGLVKYTDETLQEVMNECSVDEEKGKEVKNLINQLSESINMINQLKESLNKEVKEFQAEYKQMEEHKMEQEKKDYGMQLASLIAISIAGTIPNIADITSVFQDGKPTGSLAARMEVIHKRQNEMKDRERKNILQLAECTAGMENDVLNENQQECAVQSLVIAISCFRKVLTHLQEIKLLCMNVESFCISISDIDTMLKTISAKGDEVGEDVSAYFKTEWFVKGYIRNNAKWQTLYVIFTEYLAVLSEVTKGLKESFEQAQDIDRMRQWNLASKLAGQLKYKLESEIIEMVD